MLDDKDKEATEWLYASDDKILVCRGQGHAWPKLRRGKSIPKGVRIARQPETGCSEIHQVCRDCGTERWMLTSPAGVIDLPARYRYTYPEGYKAPIGTFMSPRDALGEMWRRIQETGTWMSEAE